VFWETEAFVLPTLVATDGAAARATLEYRIRRLEPARRRAELEGRAGARFPWESAHSGEEVRPHTDGRRPRRRMEGDIRPLSQRRESDASIRPGR
jgi:trehalose/maltose hydrolase-like predicted phosphorylase